MRSAMPATFDVKGNTISCCEFNDGADLFGSLGESYGGLVI